MKNQPKIEQNLVILHPHLLYPGGASKYMLEVSSRLAQKGIPVTVVLTQQKKDLIKQYTKIKFIEIGGLGTGDFLFWLTFPLFIFKLKKVLDGIENKILFPQIFPPVWWAAVYKYFSPKTEVVWMCQEPSAFIHSPLVIASLKEPAKTLAKILNPVLAFIDRLLVRKIDYIIANSKYGQGLIKEIYHREADIFAYPSVDPSRYQPLRKKENYLFTISRLDKQKNIDLLIKAFAFLSPKLLAKFSLLIGGEGTERGNLESLVISLGMKGKVRFLGRVEEEKLPNFYAKAKITIFLGEDEPFGIIPVESMACGTPVIALKGGGVFESIIDGKTGLLLEAKDEVQLTILINRLLTDDRLREQMSKNARVHILKNFSWDKTAQKIYDFFLKQVF